MSETDQADVRDFLSRNQDRPQILQQDLDVILRHLRMLGVAMEKDAERERTAPGLYDRTQYTKDARAKLVEAMKGSGKYRDFNDNGGIEPYGLALAMFHPHMDTSGLLGVNNLQRFGTTYGTVGSCVYNPISYFLN
jgi:hypothetical protein